MKPTKPLPAQVILRSLLDYEPSTGIFTWRWRDGWRACLNARQAGTIAGHTNSHGYIVIKIDQSAFKAHRLAWVYIYGDVLSEADEIDHFDLDRSNNRIGNLRRATIAQNQANVVGPRKRHHPLPRGVSHVKGGGTNPFQASITMNYTRLYLGVFPTAEAARDAYNRAARELHGEFARDYS